MLVAHPPTVVARVPSPHGGAESKVPVPEHHDAEGNDEQGHENDLQQFGGATAAAAAAVAFEDEESNAFDFLDALDDLCEARRATFAHLVRIGNVEAVLKVLEATPKQPHLREQVRCWLYTALRFVSRGSISYLPRLLLSVAQCGRLCLFIYCLFFPCQRYRFFLDAEVYNGDLSTNPIGEPCPPTVFRAIFCTSKLL